MKHKKLIICITTIIIILSAGLFAGVYMSYHGIQANTYSLSSDKLENDSVIRIVTIADLHDTLFDAENEELITKISEQSPDMILMVGDMLNDYSEDSGIVCSLITRLVQVAPVYYAMGNHELEYLEIHPEIVSELEAAGAEVLDRAYIDTTVNGTSVRIGGLYDYAFNLRNTENLEPDRQLVKEFLLDFESTDAYKIMMSHRPDSFIFGTAAEDWDIDLIVSAHNHGGQVVVPLLGGLYGGDQGWFPEYVHGMYELEEMDLYITNGLGSDKKMLPRVNNRPEIAVIEVTK